MSLVTFIFQAHDDGSATLQFEPSSVSPKPNFAKVDKNTPVKMKLLSPTNMSDVTDPIESATLTFHDMVYGEGWPFAGQRDADFVWHKDQKPAQTTDVNGAWKFGAVLKSKLGRTYVLPDPELQVGDGPSEGGR